MKYYCKNCGKEKKTDIGELCNSCVCKEMGKQLRGVSLSKTHKPNCQCAICKNKRNKRHLDKDILYQKYIIENKSIKTCSNELNCAISFIHGYLKKYNIPTRATKPYKVWNKGLDNTDPRIKTLGKKIAKTRRKLFKTGKIQPWNKGLTKELDKRVLKQANTYKKTHKDFKGENNPFYNKQHTKKWSREQSLRKGGTGIPGELSEYGVEFTYELKEKIRNKSNRLCVKCSKTEKDNKKKLEIHHIDYDKLNNSEDNLVALCKSCHVATNTNRNYWQEYLLK